MIDQSYTPGRPTRLAWPVLALGLGIGFLWAYWPTLAAMIQRWSNAPRYSHGYLVPVFAGIVLWFRRDSYPRGALHLSWWGVPLLGVGALVRLFAAYIYFDWLDAVSLLPTVAGGGLLFGGWPVLRWAWPATAVVVFLLPPPFPGEVALGPPLPRLGPPGGPHALPAPGLSAPA